MFQKQESYITFSNSTRSCSNRWYVNQRYKCIGRCQKSKFTIKMLNINVEITHNRHVTLENITSMMVKAIMPVLKDLKSQINNTNKQLASQYRMMSSAHNRYNLLFRQMHKTQTIHNFALLLFKNYLTM